MSKSEVGYRRALNSQQIRLLQLLYTFRFSTAKQLAQHLDRTSHKSIQDKLRILEDQELIAKHYDKSYKLQGKPAAYYLTPKGARLLPKDNPLASDERVIKQLYKNKSVSPDFITHSLNICDVALQLRRCYGDKLRFFTKTNLVPYDYFPVWRPDGYISLGEEGSWRHFFIDVCDNTQPLFVSVRKVRSYLIYSETNEWQSANESDVPLILMICEDDKTEQKLRRQIRKACSESYEENVDYATTTTQQFMASDQTTKKIWNQIYDTSELYSLEEMREPEE